MTIPETPDELHEIMLDDGRIKDVLADPTLRAEFIGKYRKSFEARDKKAVEEQVRAQVEAALADHKDQLLTRLPMTPESAGAKKIFSDRAPGADQTKWENPGEFYKAVGVAGRKGGAQDPRLKDMSSVVAADGGFLIPETLRADLLGPAMETEAAIVRPRAVTIPMSTLTVPFPTVDETDRSSSLMGGIVAYWDAEGAQATESNPKFGRIMLTARKLVGYTEVPNEMLADSIISLEAFLSNSFPRAIAFQEDEAFLTGAGSDRPLGMINAANPALIAITKETGQDATTIEWANIVNMYSRMFPSSLGRGIWVANIDTFPQLAQMSLSVGTGGAAVWLNNGAQGPPMTILGRPVIFTEKCYTLGAQGDINFIDPAFYLIGDRQTIAMAASEHHQFQNDIMAYRFIERVDGQPWVRSAVTPRVSSTTLSPYVTIAVRS
jgi:HK97 family phage major capsid protein